MGGLMILFLLGVVGAIICFGLGAWWMRRRIQVQGMGSAGTFFDWVDELA